MFKVSSKFLKSNIHEISSYKKFKLIINQGGFACCGWDGNRKTEAQIKIDTNATIRCIPFEQKNISNLYCIYTQQKAKYRVIFAKAY